MREVLGHIDCPTCGTKGGMRITSDKNGEPFGYCEATCNQQMRIGGDKRRVSAFLARFPWAAGGSVTVPLPVPEKKTESAKPVPVPEKKPVPVPEKRSAFEDAVLLLSGGRRV